MKQKLLKIIRVTVPNIFYFGEISNMSELGPKFFSLINQSLSQNKDF